jgi:hypothetical protein
VLSVLVTGILSQQLANAADESFEDGRFTRLLSRVFDMFQAHYPSAEVHHDDRRTRRRR